MVKLRSRKFFRWALVALTIAAIVAIPVIVLHTRSVHKAQHTSGTIPNSKKNTSRPKPKNENTASSASPSDKAQSSGSPNGASNSTLITPFGTFVSNHKPGQNGAPTSEQSVCNTTPGATCDIQLINGSVTKSLGVQTTNSGGTAYWSWDIKGGTLAPGTWRVAAVVKLNGQTKTATDPTPLEVQ